MKKASTCSRRVRHSLLYMYMYIINITERIDRTIQRHSFAYLHDKLFPRYAIEFYIRPYERHPIALLV